MKVLLLTLHFSPDTVSNAVVITEVAEELALRRHEVTVICAMPYHQGHAIEHGYRGRLWQAGQHGPIRVIRTWLLLRGNKTDVNKRFVAYLTFNITSTLAAVFSGRYDLVISPSPPLTIGICGWILARLWGAKFVYNVQDIYPDAAIKLGLLRKKRTIRFAQWLERFVYAHADALSVLSEGFRGNLLAKGVPASKIALIPNPVDVSFVRPQPRLNAFSREHALGERFVALYAGNVGLAQGVESLVEAAKHLRNPKVHVLVIGSGAGLEKARAAAAAQPNVQFLPFQPVERVPDVYASADVGVVLLRAGMGDSSVPSKLYTIMAAGKPVVAAVDRDSEVCRVIETAGCGVCVQPEDPAALARALDTLSAAPSNARVLGERGRAYVERFHARGRIGELYDELLTGLALATGGPNAR